MESSIGEAAGCLIAFAGKMKVPFRAIREDKELLADFQREIARQGIETKWPR